ncbi:MAG: hypothetical protein KDI83_07135 [Gammaproteobacteria bacterium]|nr:hypothetical protein [Gammaproteobacteria bacterium]
MKLPLKIGIQWLLLGPLSALLISQVSWFVYDHLSPGKLSSLAEMISVYPLGLLLSLLTPWGWLMYGGLLLLSSGKRLSGFWCTVAGALLLGGFWPVWATFLNR